MNKKIGIDIGAKNMRVSVQDRGIVLSEPSLMALNISGSEVLACGKAAEQLNDRIPGGVMLCRPFADGGKTEDSYFNMLSYLISTARPSRLYRPDVVLSVPGMIDGASEQAFVEIAQEAGANSVYVVDSLLASAKGAGINIYSDVIIINIGASLTDMAVYSHGKIVTSRSFPTAGDAFDSAIISYVSERYGVNISTDDAEEIKKNIASFHPHSQKKHLTVSGIKPVVGMPRALDLRPLELVPVLERTFDIIADNLLGMIKEVPFEVDKIVISGGSANFDGLAKSISQLTDLLTEVSPDPANCVIAGLSAIIEDGTLDKI